MQYNEINRENVNRLVRESWMNVRKRVEKNNHPLSSEKTLVFLFALEITKLVLNDGIIVDFEQQWSKDNSDSNKYLDLVVYTNIDFKVAFEMKLPRYNRSGNSNRTDIRLKIYEDWGRLSHLVTKNICQRGFFLMITNERSYINKGRYTINPDCKVHHQHKIDKKYGNGAISAIKNNRIVWKNISGKSQYKIHGKYAWLNPVKF